jgi:hypothetical protein
VIVPSHHPSSRKQRTMTMSRSYTAALALLALVAASCGGTEEPVGADPHHAHTAGNTIHVVAEDIGFAHDTFQATAGPVLVRYQNDGRISHTLVVEGIDGFKLEVDGNDDIAEGAVELEPGTYIVYCDVPGHREVGMEADLRIA